MRPQGGKIAFSLKGGRLGQTITDSVAPEVPNAPTGTPSVAAGSTVSSGEMEQVAASSIADTNASGGLKRSAEEEVAVESKRPRDSDEQEGPSEGGVDGGWLITGIMVKVGTRVELRANMVYCPFVNLARR